MTQVQEQNKILIPRKIVTTHQEGIESTINRTDRALKNLMEKSCTPVYMPQLVDARIEASKDDRVWQTYFTTPSMIITGRIKNEPVVVFDHRSDNYFGRDYRNIESAINKDLVNYAGRIPTQEFKKAVEQDGSKDEQGNRLVWALKGEDYKRFRDSKSGLIPVEQALEHPQTIPFLGGKKRAQTYLKRHKEIYGDKIGIWHFDDLQGDEPLGRLLYLGLNLGLLGGSDLDYRARFVGVRAQNFGPTQTKQTSGFSIEEVLKLTQDYIPKAARQEFEQKLRNSSR